MKRHIFIAPILLLVTSTCGFGQTSQLTGNSEIEAAANSIRQRHTVVVQKPVREVRTITEIRYCRFGLFGHRIRAVRVQRQVVAERMSSETLTNLDDGIGWNNLGDPRLGFSTVNYPIRMLPAAAGARASKINRAAETLLKEGINVDAAFGLLDKVLVRTPLSLATPIGTRELVRVEALVGGPDDENATIEVKVQQRDAAGNLVSSPAALNARAKAILDGIIAELNK